MSKKYANPPVVEAVCEIRFPPDQKWDFTIPGVLYEKVKTEYQEKESITLPIGNRAVEFAVFRSKRENTMIRVGIQVPILSIIRQKPYTTWHEFSPQITKAYNELKTIDGVEIKGIQRIGLLYVNLIEIPQGTVQLDNYFEYAPYLGERLPKELRTFLLGSEFNFSDGRDVCRVQLASTVPATTGQYRTRLDLDYYLAQPQAVSPNEVITWVENAHTKVEELFEGCITDKTRKLFGEVK